MYNPDIHHRRTIRLQGYDYDGAGAYFVTLCTFQRECLFGKIVDGEMQLNEYGLAVLECWTDIQNNFPNVALDEYVIMPNHHHGILVINNVPVGVKQASPVFGLSWESLVKVKVGTNVKTRAKQVKLLLRPYAKNLVNQHQGQNHDTPTPRAFPIRSASAAS